MSEGEVFIFPLVTLGASYAFFWVILKLLRVRRKGLPSLLAIITSFVLAPFHPFGLAIAAMPFILGYKAGRSTSLPVNPTDTFSPRVKVSDEEYGYRAEQFRELMYSIATQRFLLSEWVPWPDKMSLMFTWHGFGLYRRAPLLAAVATPFHVAIWSLANLEGELWGSHSLLLFLLSLPYGTALGNLVKYVKAQRGR